MPFSEVPAFMARLRERESVSAKALELVILTAARSGEVRGATWTEIDLDKKLWILPEGAGCYRTGNSRSDFCS
jgi:integrase